MTLASIHPRERQDGQMVTRDIELNFLARLVQAMAEAHLPVAPISVINLYVSLKSKPLVLLVGPTDEPKEAFLKRFTAELNDGSSIPCQTMAGHAWWAASTDNVARFTRAQTAFNEVKISALLSEASQAENAGDVFIACLMKISPAELDGCFSTLAGLIEKTGLSPLPGGYYWPPFPFPPNVLIAGTMDAGLFPGCEEAFLSQTTVITDAFGEPPEPFPFPRIADFDDRPAWGAWIRDETRAHVRLRRIPGWHSRSLEPAMRVAGALLKYDVPLQTRRATGEVLVYLANSWSQAGNGLFANLFEKNLNTAIDLAISQILLTRGWEVLRNSPPLRQAIKVVLDDRFPRSHRFIENVEDGSHSRQVAYR